MTAAGEPTADGRHTVARWLFNPFHYIAGGGALGLGLTAILVASLLGSLSRSHFDGVLDFHTGLAVPTWVYPIEGLVDWLALALPLWAGGTLLSPSRVRAVDIFGAQALARWPTVGVAIVALTPGYRRVTEQLVGTLGQGVRELDVPTGELLIFSFVSLVILVLIVWMVALMYRGFAVACNLKGARAVVYFIVALLVGEVLSKLALAFLLRPLVVGGAG